MDQFGFCAGHAARFLIKTRSAFYDSINDIHALIFCHVFYSAYEGTLFYVTDNHKSYYYNLIFILHLGLCPHTNQLPLTNL